MIETEFVPIDDDFIDLQPRRKRPPPTAAKPNSKMDEDEEAAWKKRYQPHERTALLGPREPEEDRERKRNRLIKIVFLILFGLGALEVVLITAFSTWVIHMVSCLVYGTCTPSGQGLASFGIYFGILFGVFLVPYIIGTLGVLTSAPRILWFFSFVTALIDIIVVVLLCVYVRWEVALAMAPQILIALFGFAVSSMLSKEGAERGPDARHNRCCLFLC